MGEVPPFVLILGMHRSGTSCLAGCLERCGLHLGDVRRTGRHNARGYYEPGAVVRIHDQILALNRGSWDSPPGQVRLHPHHGRLLKTVADRLARRRPCGLKDPRLLLLEEWLEIAPPPIHLVGIFRHPAAVAASLAKRDGMPAPRALALWLNYNERLADLHRKAPFPLVEFDLADVVAFVQNVSAVARLQGLRPSTPHLRRFVATELEHCRPGDLVVPETCREVFEYLRSHRLVAETPSDGPRHLPLALERGVGAVREATYRAGRALDGILGRGRRAIAERARQDLTPSGRSPLKSLQRLRCRRVARAEPLDALRGVLLFVGNARSGTTLVRSLLDAHPEVVLGNEVHVLKRIAEGEDWETVIGRIFLSSRQFTRNPTWTGYRYKVPGLAAGGNHRLRIIGDKKAGRTAQLLHADSDLLLRALSWAHAQLVFLHVVRHPLDVIASNVRLNHLPLAQNVPSYFELERTAAEVSRILGPGRVKTIYFEELIADPEAVLPELFRFLEMGLEPGFVSACRSLMFREPNRSSRMVAWNPEALAAVEAGIREIPHLGRYQVGREDLALDD